jgi:predicted XRE-type DNA-binding protein
MTLKEWLKESGTTQLELSERAGLDQATISRAMNAGVCSRATMLALYDATSGAVTPNDLVLERVA